MPRFSARGLEDNDAPQIVRDQQQETPFRGFPRTPVRHPPVLQPILEADELDNEEESVTMESSMRPPAALSFDGNLKENWRKWRQRFELYLKATGLDTKPAERQVAVLLHVIGDEALDRFDTFGLSDEEKKVVQTVINAFENFCTPKANESVDRHIFFTRKQQPGETFSSFITDLKKLSSVCGFGELRDSLIKDSVICGIIDQDLKQRLLREENLTLDKCINICKAAELSQTQLKTIEAENKVNVVKVTPNQNQQNHKKRGKQQGGKNQNETQPRGASQSFQPSSAKSSQQRQQQQRKPCHRCNKFHPMNQCPAWGKKCSSCGKQNHFAYVCKFNNVNTIQNVSQEVESLFIGNVSISKNEGDWCEMMQVDDRVKVNVKLDTGAQRNVISFENLQQLCSEEPNLEKFDAVLKAYGGTKIPVLGKCFLTCKFENRSPSMLEFIVVDGNTNVPTVIGSPTLKKLELVQRIDVIQENKVKNSLKKGKVAKNKFIDNYKKVFSGIGCVKNYQYDINLEDDAEPKILPCRKVPVVLMDPLKTELEKMEKLAIIEKVQGPSDWVNQFVIVRKPDGSLRICIDPTHLNKSIKREHFKIPSFEELCSKMPGAKIFSTLDADKAFWQIQLSEKSSHLLTFNTPFGRYRYLRMPYGITSASEIFQSIFHMIFGDLEGVIIYVDDLMIWGENEKQHDERVENVLKRAEQWGITFNLKKCTFNADEVKYVGHNFSKEGIKVDEEKVKAITNMERPKNKKELESFLGMLAYVSKYIPHVSQETAQLRNLIKRDVPWLWDENVEQSYQRLKEILIKNPVLQYFDVNKPVTLSVDASKDGLGSVLLQNNLPVAYASKSLNDTEKSYAQIEKETLAICFACERFCHYIYGKKVIVESDHKPLEFIFKKSLNECPARLLRMRLKLQKYDLEIKYKPGKELLLADALSRNYLTVETQKDAEVEAQVFLLLESFPISIEKKQEFQKVTHEDDEMQMLIKYIQEGWPNESQKIPNVLRPYHTFADELCVINGLIFKGDRIVVPRKLRKDLLNKIHYCHLGVEKCKNRAREIVYWPGMNQQIENIVNSCDSCMRYKKANSKESLLPQEVPNGAWEQLGIDLFEFKNCHWILVIDYYSKYVEVAKLDNMFGVTIVSKLKSIFARFGIPKKIISDNGTHFVNQDMKHFATEWNFEHVTSSPNYPKSNGMVERHIGTIKNMFKKIEHGGTDPTLALLEYRNTPISNEIKSPNELLLGHKTRGIIPLCVKKNVCEEDRLVRQKLLQRQSEQKLYYDRNSHDLKPLNVADNVYVRRQVDKPLEPAIVTKICNRPRSYELQMSNGRKLERNRSHLYETVSEKNECEKTVQNETLQNASVSNPVRSPESIIFKQNVNENSNQNVQNKQTFVTQSGRISRPPSYLKDYVK